MAQNGGPYVYLLCFAKNGRKARYHHAGHYLGFTENLSRRMDQHRAGTGARLTGVIKEAGLGFNVARLWEGGRELERRLKRQHNSPRLCPICNPAIRRTKIEIEEEIDFYG
jgi:predicted GIY-YIG superfamily endonuclease